MCSKFRKRKKDTTIRLSHSSFTFWKQLKEREKKHWVKVICPADKEPFYSIRFQEELSKWLAQKKEEYQKELEEL